MGISATGGSATRIMSRLSLATATEYFFTSEFQRRSRRAARFTSRLSLATATEYFFISEFQRRSRRVTRSTSRLSLATATEYFFLWEFQRPEGARRVLRAGLVCLWGKRVSADFWSRTFHNIRRTCGNTTGNRNFTVQKLLRFVFIG